VQPVKAFFLMGCASAAEAARFLLKTYRKSVPGTMFSCSS
jgi:hypothetical protein